MSQQHQHKPLYLCESKKPAEQTTKQVAVPAENASLQQKCCSHDHQLTRPRLRKFIYTLSEQQRVETHSSSSSSSFTKSANSEIIATADKASTGEIKHFSHAHSLALYKVKEEHGMFCVICKLNLFGSAYGCKDCDFFLHKSCLNLPREITHESHKDHPLILLPHSPYKSGRFICNACLDWGYGFQYHCEPCKYDLHVSCIALPKIVYRADFKYPLNLSFSNPIHLKDKDMLANCCICRTIISKEGFVYCNRDTDYVTHLSCALDEGCTKEELEDFIAQIQSKFQEL